MSIQSEIDRISGNIAGAYSAVEAKGGQVPEAANSENLAAAVASIPAGGITLASIAITAPPAKTSYLVGGTFDPAGMEITATYSNGATAVVTGFSYAPEGPLTENDTMITVSYMETGVTAMTEQPIFVSADSVIGVVWDTSNPATAMTRLTIDSDPNGLVTIDITKEPVPAVGNGEGSSPFDSYAPWKDMEEYNIIDNVVTYKRGDAGFSRSDYDTVVYVPEFWYKALLVSGKQYFYVSAAEKEGFEKHPGSGKYVGRYKTGPGYVSKTGTAPLVSITRAAARTGSAAKGDKWSQYDFASWGAAEFLFRVEFADWDSQSKVGRGYVDGNSAAINNGGTDSMIYHTGRAAGEDGKTAVQYRHIENPWGNVYEWIDGINFNACAAYICLDRTKFADDTSSNYTSAGVTLPSGGWIKSLGISNNASWAFLPNADWGSDATYVPDYVYSSIGWCVLRVGGYWSGRSSTGLWCFYASYNSSASNASSGARLLYNPHRGSGGPRSPSEQTRF